MRGPTEHSLSYRAPTLEPSVPVLGGVRPRVKNAGFGPTFFRPSLPEGETQQTKKAIRDKCPISPTKSKSIGTEGSCLRPFPRVWGRGPAPGWAASHMYLTLLPLVPMLQGRAPRLLCHTRRRHLREGQSCNTATLPKRAGKERTVVPDARGVVVRGPFRELGRGSAPGWPASHMFFFSSSSTYASGACSTAPLPHKEATLARVPEL